MNEEINKDYGNLVAKKSERLVTALYLVTDLMSDSDPIKHGLRKNSVALLSSMNALSQHDVKDRVTEFKLSLRAVTEITSLLQVSITTGIVSEMNGTLLMEGFRALQLVLEKKQPILTKEMLTVDNESDLSKEGSFPSAITTTSYDALTPLSLARLHSNTQELRLTQESIKQDRLLSKLQNIDHKRQKISPNNLDKKETNFSSSQLKTQAKKDFNIKDRSSTRAVLMEHAVKPSSTLASSFQMRKQSRREQILALFVKGVDISIKDIASRIRGCSEKTIQRELNNLLYDNVIERIGEKRWSRYVLR